MTTLDAKERADVLDAADMLDTSAEEILPIDKVESTDIGDNDVVIVFAKGSA